MTKPRRKKFDPGVVIGLVIAIASILGGLVLEKGELRDVAQITAALIVLGGTCGAVVISTPFPALVRAIKRSRSVFWSSEDNTAAILDDLVRLAGIHRRAGLLALDSEVPKMANTFLKKGLMMMVDGADPEELRSVLEIELLVSEKEQENDARVFETAGGFAPTIGIIGAVLGLMQVMKHLDSIQDVGRGIAIAFVATVYGVGLANLVFLPIGSKIRALVHQESNLREMMIEGLINIQQGKNPKLIRQKLNVFTGAKEELPGRERVSAGPTLTEDRIAS